MNGQAENSSITAGLVTEQARALVQIEEARFAGVQSRAIALLAAAGVIASVGGSVLTRLGDREFGLPLSIFDKEISLVFIAACLTGGIAIFALLGSAAVALVALQKNPDPEPQRLIHVVNEQFPSMLSQEAAESSRLILLLLAGQLELVQEAIEKLNGALKGCVRLLSLALASGFALYAIVLFGTRSADQSTHYFQMNADNQSRQKAR